MGTASQADHNNTDPAGHWSDYSRAEFVWENIKSYSYFLSFLNTRNMQV